MIGLTLAQCIHAYGAYGKEINKLHFNDFRYVNKLSKFTRIKTYN